MQSLSNLASNAIIIFERKISGKGAARAGKGFNLFISEEDMNDIIKTLKSFEDSGVLIDGVTETVKHEINKSWIFRSSFSCFSRATSVFSVVKCIS